ncbi:MAG: hypothetical protein ABIK96_03550 [bacterium]
MPKTAHDSTLSARILLLAAFAALTLAPGISAAAQRAVVAELYSADG